MISFSKEDIYILVQMQTFAFEKDLDERDRNTIYDAFLVNN